MIGAIWINVNIKRVYKMKKTRYLVKQKSAQYLMVSSKIEEVRTFPFIPKSLQLFYIHGKYHDFIHGKEFIPFVIPAKQPRW